MVQKKDNPWRKFLKASAFFPLFAYGFLVIFAHWKEGQVSILGFVIENDMSPRNLSLLVICVVGYMILWSKAAYDVVYGRDEQRD